MLSREDVVEIVALYRRGWSVSAIARHTGRDRKTVRAWLAGERARRERPASVLEPYRAYVERRLGDDPHLDATVLLRELRPLGFARSYPTLTRELRRLGLRPACPACKRGGHRLTVELVHEPGEELQLDWLELDETPWGEPAHVLVAALSHSGRIRAVLSEGEDFAHLVAALDDVLRRLGGTARCWRTDRMASLVSPQSGRLRPEAAELAKHCGVTVAVCPPRRAQRKGVVEAAIRYIERSWWRSAPVAGVREAQSSLDEWCVEVADARRRGGQTVAGLAAAEPLSPLPPVAYPAMLDVERVVSASALVAFDGNRLQRAARPGRPSGACLPPARRAGPARRLGSRRRARHASASARRRRPARPHAGARRGVGAGGAGRLHHPAAVRAQAEPAAFG
jgi:transposase